LPERLSAKPYGYLDGTPPYGARRAAADPPAADEGPRRRPGSR